MKEMDKEKTAFAMKFGLCEFNVIPFCNGPTTFQWLMEHVWLNLQWKILVLYLDDVVVCAETVEEHLEYHLGMPERGGAPVETKEMQCPTTMCDVSRTHSR